MKKLLLLALALVLALPAFSFGAVAEGEVHPMRYVQPGTLPTEYDIGIAAVNEKLAADGLGIEVEIIRIPWGEYDTKLNLMLSTGEPFELIHVMQDVKNMSALAAMDAIVSVDPYLAYEIRRSDWSPSSPTPSGWAPCTTANTTPCPAPGAPSTTPCPTSTCAPTS